MPLAKDMPNLDERTRKFIEDFESSMESLSKSIKDGDMTKVSLTLDELQKQTDKYIVET